MGSDRVKREAKEVEDELKRLGFGAKAQSIARLRRGYAAAINTLSALHADNMELRKQLSLPSYLDEQKEKPE